MSGKTTNLHKNIRHFGISVIMESGNVLEKLKYAL